MTNSPPDLEALFNKVRTLPDEHRDRVAEALAELTSDEPYQLSPEELSILEPELEGARNGLFASQQDVDDVLRKPWRKRNPG